MQQKMSNVSINTKDKCCSVILSCFILYVCVDKTYFLTMAYRYFVVVLKLENFALHDLKVLPFKIILFCPGSLLFYV